MREITDHVVEGDTAPQLIVKVLDEPGAGGANHEYLVRGKTTGRIPPTDNAEIDGDGVITFDTCRISFQNGPIKEAGVNGITEAAMLAILIDRLKSFQAGPFASAYNETALRHGKEMLLALQRRTRDRIARGVEGVSRA